MSRALIPRRYTPLLYLTFILLVVGATRITTFFFIQAIDPARILVPDSTAYVQTAHAILQTGRFAVSPEFPERLQVERTPGYPLFIATLFSLFGENFALLGIIQILFSLGTIIVTYVLASKLWEPPIGLLAALLLACDLPSFINAQQVLTDTLFTFVLSLALLSGWASLKDAPQRSSQIFVHGLLLALATLIRPITAYLIFPLLLAFIFMWRGCEKLTWKQIVLLTFLLLLPWGLLIGGWQVRNYAATGSAELSQVVGWNLLFCRGAGIIAEREGITLEHARKRLGFGEYSTLHPETQGWSIAELNQRWKREGIRIILRHPWLFVKSQIRGLLTMLFGPGKKTFLAYIWGEQDETPQPADTFLERLLPRFLHPLFEPLALSPVFVLTELYLIVLYGSIGISVWSLLRSPSAACPDSLGGKICRLRIHVWLWISLAYLLLVSISVGPEAYSRFRIPLMPLFSLYAAHGISQGISRYRSNTRSLGHNSCQRRF
ncbi:phospholipid carrier-dependent glycosyltransferase [candidate division KSB3 bacterium]|uniref:Phospholipid carrier-dependent glycosyltransferase n=1 Tax=candidate division KSB3 bacterium TaxID=2044937 RepID=A0A9D5JV45_9BACT|nr:phospholipid carrier-dependent glycosyltransferase [candidate division KSB3 bacterium]MBD3324708.1 phospholipid carrier-dependent glycosyltransferase [candidate division KSB3 bacterium]